MTSELQDSQGAITAALTQLATSVAANTATVAALERSTGEGMRAINGRLDKFDDRLGGLERGQAGIDARVQALEEKDRNRAKNDGDIALVDRANRTALVDSASNYKMLRTVGAAIVGTLVAVAGIARAIALLHGGG